MQIVIIVVDTVISIHALLAESDVVHIAEHASPGGISIHALLAESDLVNGDAPSSCFGNFYPRSPCGERPLTDDVSTGGKIFLSTLSLRRATLATWQ